MAAAPLRALGREFAPWARALRRQAAASPDAVALDDAWLPLPALHDRLLRGDAARDGSTDLVLVPTDWLAVLIDDGHLLPLASGQPDDWADAWTPSLRGLQTLGDHAYGLPYHDGPTMLLYRTDLLDGPPPTTWAGVLDAAHAHTDRAAGRYGTVLAGLPDGHNDVYDFVALLDAHGGRLLDDAGRPAFADAAGEAALTFLHDLWHVHRVVSPEARRWDSVASGERFAAGEGALMVNWAGFAAMAADPASPTHGRIGCAPPPGRALNAFWVLAVAAGARDPERARAFVRHVGSAPMDRITALEGGSATRRSTWADPEIRALAPYYAALEDAHAGALTLPRTRHEAALRSVLSRAVDAAVSRRADPAAALRTAAPEAAAVLSVPHEGALR